MRKNVMSSTPTPPIKYSDLEATAPAELPELPFLPSTDKAILRKAVRKAIDQRREKKPPEACNPVRG